MFFQGKQKTETKKDLLYSSHKHMDGHEPEHDRHPHGLAAGDIFYGPAPEQEPL